MMQENAIPCHGRPVLTVDLKKLQENYQRTRELCQRHNIHMTGVIKGCSALPECIKVADKAGCDFLASSRLSHLQRCRDLQVRTPLMLLRTPAVSQLDKVVQLADVSLESDIDVLCALNGEAMEAGVIHQVILMVELGDLREGFWKQEELLQAAMLTEFQLKNLKLLGIGTNLGCYGSIVPTPKKLTELLDAVKMIEKSIGRKLEYISGGATTSLQRLLDDTMPEKINHLRIGDGILTAFRGRQTLDFLHKDVFRLTAELIEVREKPSYPMGVIGEDAYGFTQEYEDKGLRLRGILAVGKADYSYPELLFAEDKGVTILGASSDHTLVDLTDSNREWLVGDTMSFGLGYGALVPLTSNSGEIEIRYR